LHSKEGHFIVNILEHVRQRDCKGLNKNNSMNRWNLSIGLNTISQLLSHLVKWEHLEDVTVFEVKLGIPQLVVRCLQERRILNWPPKRRMCYLLPTISREWHSLTLWVSMVSCFF